MLWESSLVVEPRLGFTLSVRKLAVISSVCVADSLFSSALGQSHRTWRRGWCQNGNRPPERRRDRHASVTPKPTVSGIGDDIERSVSVAAESACPVFICDSRFPVLRDGSAAGECKPVSARSCGRLPAIRERKSLPNRYPRIISFVERMLQR